MPEPFDAWNPGVEVTRSPRWQEGYDDGGGMGTDPQHPDDSVYHSGWLHGHNATAQCSGEDSEAAWSEAVGEPRASAPDEVTA